MRNMDNPFKFGTLVDNQYFTDRVEEQLRIEAILNSPNHLVLISPRRFGKSSLVRRTVLKTGRPVISLNMQQVTSSEELASMILKGVFKLHPWEKIKNLFANFRFIPTISTTPLGDGVEISFHPSANSSVLLEDSLSLVEKISTPENRIVVIMDEFQEILDIEKGIDKKLRAIMQEQENINYIFLGSEESMMTDIFERKKSPFYHFGMLMRLKKIPYGDFYTYLIDRLRQVINNDAETLAKAILDFTQCHPYYTQQLASVVWDAACYKKLPTDNLIEYALNFIVQTHDLDYERIWMSVNTTDRRILKTMAKRENAYESRAIPPSTTYSAIKRLLKKGFLIKDKEYALEDPFFRIWICEQNK